MTVESFIADTYLRATGKTATLTTGTKYERIIALGNYYQRRWARAKDVDWHSLYNPAYTVGSVTATDTFALNATAVRKLSNREGDVVRIVHSDGVGYTDYSIVKHDKLKDYYFGVTKQSPVGNYCTQIGRNLVFNHTFVSTDDQFGGSIKAPVYAYPETIDDAAPTVDTIQVDDPDWLVTRCAAEYVRNDITRRQRYPELLAEANDIMARMMDDNEAQLDTIDMPWTPFSGENDAWG
jgi:hypothetical protein